MSSLVKSIIESLAVITWLRSLVWIVLKENSFILAAKDQAMLILVTEDMVLHLHFSLRHGKLFGDGIIVELHLKVFELSLALLIIHN